jgi:hypothetical protein
LAGIGHHPPPTQVFLGDLTGKNSEEGLIGRSMGGPQEDVNVIALNGNLLDFDEEAAGVLFGEIMNELMGFVRSQTNASVAAIDFENTMDR